MQLCAMGGDVTAIDLSEARTERLSQNLARTNSGATVVTTDITDYTPDAPFDAVLLDAPCSATGTFRRHPDVLYNRREKDITPLTRIQDKLLAAAAKMTAPGGVLLYSVCSLQEREGLARVDKLVKALPEFRRIPLPALDGLDLPDERVERDSLRILPVDAPDGRGMDGFFIAALRRDGGAP
ncbi:MAG: rRNA methyltransferase, partial [Litorimonas sp.]